MKGGQVGEGGSGFLSFFLGGGGVQGGCEWRSEAFVKIQKKKNSQKLHFSIHSHPDPPTRHLPPKKLFFFWGGGGGGVGSGGGVGLGGQGGWERRSEACVKIQKKNWGVGVGGGGGSGWGVRVAVNGEVKLL